MSTAGRSSEELFDQLVDVLIDEGMTAEEFDIDAMPFAQMERFGHGLGRQLAQRIQEALATRQGEPDGRGLRLSCRCLLPVVANGVS